MSTVHPEEVLLPQATFMRVLLYEQILPTCINVICLTVLLIRIACEKLPERFSAYAVFPSQREIINTTERHFCLNYASVVCLLMKNKYKAQTVTISWCRLVLPSPALKSSCNLAYQCDRYKTGAWLNIIITTLANLHRLKYSEVVCFQMTSSWY